MTTLPFEEYTFVLVLHLLSDVQGFLRAMLQLGLKPEQSILVNIPYSTKPETLAALWTRGFRNCFVSEEYPIEGAVQEAVEAAARISTATGTRIIVIEDGGYVGPYIHRSRPELLVSVAGIVEQTQNGIWQYEGDESIGLPAVEPLIPIVSVAESELKKALESPLIGEAVYFNIVDLVGRLGYSVAPLQTLILGYGATGSQVAERFGRAHPHNTPKVFDRDQNRLEEAQKDGFEIVTDLDSACADAELIIGCTGRESISGDLLLRLRRICYFANGSSKRKELDWKALESYQTGSRMLPRSVGRQVDFAGGHRLTLLADGYPVNFAGESVPDEEIAFVYGLLLRSALLIASGALRPGFCEVPDEIQAQVKDDHFRLLGRSQPD